MYKKMRNILFVYFENLVNWINKSNPKIEYFCRNCQKKLSKRYNECPYCGFLGRDVRMLARDSIKIGENYFRIRLGRYGFPKFVYELLRRYKLSGDRRLPEGVYEDRMIDKEKDIYDKTIYKVSKGRIGKVIHRNKEKLSAHRKAH